MPHSMFFNKKKRMVFLFIDALLLLTSAAITKALFITTQTDMFLGVWTLMSIINLYIFGRYSNHSNALYPNMIRVTLGVILPVFISYPFLSGGDIERIRVSIFLYLLTITLLLLFTYLKKKLPSLTEKKKSIVFFLPNTLINSNRYTDFKNRLINEGCIVEEYAINENSINNSLMPNWDIIIYDSRLSIDDSFSQNLLKEKIKGRKIVDFITFYSSSTGRIPLELIDSPYLLNSIKTFSNRKKTDRLMRTLDVLTGLVLLILFLIPAIIIFLLIKYESKGPAIFKQERVGKNLKPFTLYKFRSMKLDAEKNGPQWATKDDVRSTRVGKLLRTTHLDELPQIINVILGDISLVGPRPIRLHFTKKLTKQIPFYHLRNLVKPGLTGWAQINAPRGANLDEEKIKLEMDLYYLQNSSIMMNLLIILSTGRHVTTPAETCDAESIFGSFRRKTN